MGNDALQLDIINTSYVAGEQPTATKLNQAAVQLENAVSTIGEAVGDIYNSGSHTGTQGGSHSYQLHTHLPLAGPNLARLLGSSGWMNPRHLGRIRVASKTVVFVCGTSLSGSMTVKGTNHYNKRVFKLPFPPIFYNNAVGDENFESDILYSWTAPVSDWTISAPPAPYVDASAKLGTQVTYPGQLNAANEYCVEQDGTITLFTPLEPDEGFTVTYTFDTVSDSYDGASLNVIPDFTQTTTLCTTTLVSGTQYTITLPTIETRRGYTGTRDASDIMHPRDFYPWATNVDDPMYGTQLLLPYSLTTNCGADDVIPEGFIHIYDEDADQILSGATFTYVSTSSVKCNGLVLEECSDRYRLIVGGTTVAGVLSSLREAFLRHNHAGRVLFPEQSWSGNRVAHSDLDYLIDEGGSIAGQERSGFSISLLGQTRNPHPQYLHRYGYSYATATASLGDGGTTGGNFNNALLGSLLIAGWDSGDSDYQVSTDNDSFSLYFGSTTGPRFYWDNSDQVLKFDNYYLSPEYGIYNAGRGLLGTAAGARTYARFQAFMAPQATSTYTLMEEYAPDAADTTRSSIRTYAMTDCPFNTTGGWTTTVNADLQSDGSWAADTTNHDASRLDLIPNNLLFYTYDATADSAWAEADWDNSPTQPGIAAFRVYGNATTGTSQMFLRDGYLMFSNASSAQSNPAKTSAPEADTLYAKNIPKAWARITSGGSPAESDGFGIASLGAGAGDALRVTLDQPMASSSYCPMVTDGGTTPNLYSTNIIDASNFDVYCWSITVASPAVTASVNLNSASVVFSISVYGEQA